MKSLKKKDSSLTIKKKSMIAWLVALPCEAKAIVSHFKLQLCLSYPWKLYRDAKAEQFLIISGVGGYNCAAALAFLNQYLGHARHICYLNFGIAGKYEAQLGDIYQVNKVLPKSKIEI